ncbi:MAG: hypothetical protein D6714_19380 [Bacteroidetes bacterium]|nr:MAG: hypothetical protein D6714_19380 [Bacteroidota bacterium]
MKTWILLFSVLVLAACGGTSTEETEENALQKEIYSIHDAVMPEMSTINRVSRELKKRKDSVQDSVVLVQIDSAVAILEKADDGMMDWMQNYKDPSLLRGKKTHAEIMEYLKEEKQKITRVKQLMEKSIADGEALLKNINPDEGTKQN